MRFKPLGKLVRRMAEYFWYYGASLLDLGCGKLKSVRASEVYEIDLDEENVRRTRERGIIVYRSYLNRKFPLYKNALMLSSKNVFK
jgi:hypothetical protein